MKKRRTKASERGFFGGTYGPAGPAVSLVTGEVFDAGQRQAKRLRKTMAKGPRHSDRQAAAINRTRCTQCGSKGANILVTAGGRPDGSLIVHMLCNRACAARAGFGWAGR